MNDLSLISTALSHNVPGLLNDVIGEPGSDRLRRSARPPLPVARIQRGRRAHSLPARGISPHFQASQSEGAPFSEVTIAGAVQRETTCGGEVRQSLRRLMNQLDVPGWVQFDVLLAAGEIVTNGVRYGRGNEIHWCAAASSDHVVIEIEYATDQFDTSPAPSEHGLMKEHGRGLGLIRALMDNVQFQFSRGVVRVFLIKKWNV